MEWVALAIWGSTACVGLYLLGVWLRHGGLRQQATRITVFPAALVFAHPVLATSGAEQSFPVRVVAMHGMVGLTTFALVLITSTLATRQH